MGEFGNDEMGKEDWDTSIMAKFKDICCKETCVGRTTINWRKFVATVTWVVGKREIDLNGRRNGWDTSFKYFFFWGIFEGHERCDSLRSVSREM